MSALLDTAILYDIENLIGGYGNLDLISSLSLREIHSRITSLDMVGGIAIQRAYANWSDPRLGILRGDILELGIDPVQMFGFGRGAQKNASDIQLAIDAMDIAFTRSHVRCFVIVSGDGAFASLAKRLHEYGRQVIGCAYEKTTNKVFASVCDHFLWLPVPQELERNGEAENVDPILAEYRARHQPLTGGVDHEAEAVRILQYLRQSKAARRYLQVQGLNISILSQILNYRMPDFHYLRLGFGRFTDFIRYIIRDQGLKLVLREPSDYRLLDAAVDLPGFVPVPPLQERLPVHGKEVYSMILSRKFPVFRQELDREIFSEIVAYLVAEGYDSQRHALGDLIAHVQDALEFAETDIKNVLLTLVAAQCFRREPEGRKLSEQQLQLLDGSEERVIRRVETAMREEIAGLLGEVREDVLHPLMAECGIYLEA